MIQGNAYGLDNAMENCPSLSVYLYHKGSFSVAESPLGKIDISLENFSTEEDDRWHPIVADGRTTDVSGEVR